MRDSIAVFCGSSMGNKPEYKAAAESLGKAFATGKRRLVYGGGNSGLMGVTSSQAALSGAQVVGVTPRALHEAEGGETDKGATFISSSASSSLPLNGNGSGNSNGNGGSSTNGMAKTTSSESASAAPTTTHLDLPNVETILVDSMHSRKMMMSMKSEAFIVLPGGFGTLEELFEMTTWTQLEIHSKPVIILNVEGFYEPMRTLITNSIASGFISAHHDQVVQFVTKPADASPDWDWGFEALKVVDAWQPVANMRGLKWKSASCAPEDAMSMT